MIFDWDNRWALDDAWGMQIKQKNLRETCCQLYAQLNHCGVETDVVGVDADLNRYKLVVLPMLFMTKPGFAQKIREYVETAAPLWPPICWAMWMKAPCVGWAGSPVTACAKCLA